MTGVGPGEVVLPHARLAVVARDERAVVAMLRAEVASALATEAASERGQREMAETLVSAALDRYAASELASGRPVPDYDTEQRLRRAIFDALFGLGGLQRYLDDPDVENIDVNGADVVHVRYADGRRVQAEPLASSDGELIEQVRTLATRAGSHEHRFDRASPAISVRLPDGSRLTAVMTVTARPCISVRRNRYPMASLTELRMNGSFDDGLLAFLTSAVRARRNILIAGGTGAGKTTLLRALAGAIDPGERLITIEDVLELGLDTDGRHPNAIAMQARQANLEGAGEISQGELVRWGLRMSPDRVIVGEVRGGELIPMLNAMSQGTDGSMGTIHASSSRGVFTKLAAYAAQCAERLSLEATNLLVASAIHLIIHLGLDNTGQRVVSSIREIVDVDDAARQIVSNEIYRPGPDGRARPASPPQHATLEALIGAGFDPFWLHNPNGWSNR